MTARLSTFLSSSLAFLLFATLAMGFGGRLGAQIPDFDAGPDAQKVSIRTEVVPKTARPGEIATLVVTLEIIPGWHVYGRLQDPSLGSPTELDVDEHGALVPLGPTIVPAGEPHGEGEFLTYDLEGVATLSQRFVVPQDTQAGEITLAGTVAYMACDASNCDDAKDDPWSVKLVIEEGEAREAHAQKKVEILRAFTEKGARAGEVVDVVVEVLVKDGFYIYGSKEPSGIPPSLKTMLDGDKPFEALAAKIPEGEEHEVAGLDEKSYHLVGKVALRQPLRVKASAKPFTHGIKGELTYQVCDEKSCDLPATIPWTAEVAVEKGAAREGRMGTVSGANADAGDAPKTGVAGLKSEGLWSLILLAIGGALFALAMPCTYPMIPITISFFTKQAEARGGNVLPLALVYGFGIIAIFVLIGVVFGGVIVPFAAHWITNLVIGLFFLVFALSLFGLFTLQPPRFLIDAAGQASNQGGYLGVFLMGATLVVTSFTCTAPFVGNILAVGAQGGIGLAAFGMGVFGLTMAIPFVALALVPGAVSAMPNSGMWMNTLKVFLGFVEVAAALKFLSNVDLQLEWGILPRELFLYLWAATFGLAGYYLLGRIQLKGESSEIGAGRLVGALTVILLGVYFWNGAVGNKLDWVSESIVPPYSSQEEAKKSWRIVEDDFDEAVRIARAEKKLLFLNITGIT